jgi:hypothetical protein
MNRSLRYIIMLAVCMLTLASPTCVDDVSFDKKVQLEREQLQAVSEDFSTGSLTKRNLIAFEHRAAEKLMDYNDYLSIVYDQNLDEAFHYQAGENIRNLFSGRSAPENPLPFGIDPESYTSIIFQLDTIEIIIPLEKQPEETYKGSMQYFQKILGITGSDTLNLDSSLHQMGMQLQMSLKDFGEDSLLVWEVLLREEK